MRGVGLKEPTLEVAVTWPIGSSTKCLNITKFVQHKVVFHQGKLHYLKAASQSGLECEPALIGNAISGNERKRNLKMQMQLPIGATGANANAIGANPL